MAEPHWMASSDIGSHPVGWLPLSAGDFNHDGTNDVLWFDSTTNDVDLWKNQNGKWAACISGKRRWKYVAEFSYRRNIRHTHASMFNLLVQAFGLPRLKTA
jgi:hypothetical protein